MDALTVAPRCSCKACQHMGARIHREFWGPILLGMATPPVDIEAELAKRWHEYLPHLERVARRLPHHAAHVTYQAKETVALRRMRDLYDRTGEFEDYDPDADRCIVVLSGPTGTGKTVSVSWLAMHRLAADPPLFMTGPELTRVPRDGDEREELLSAPSLIVDDLGVERADKKFETDFDELVNAYYQSGGTLVVTTNCTPSQFEKRYGRRVVDRLAERGTWLAVVGKTMRRAAA